MLMISSIVYAQEKHGPGWKSSNCDNIIDPDQAVICNMMWSDKLGLCYKEVFDDYDIANECLNKIKWSKYIDIREWDKDFYPSKYYLQTYAD